MKIIVFEDSRYNNFYPLSLTKPLWELRIGCFKFWERIELFLKDYFNTDPSDLYYFTREYLAPLYKEIYPEKKINDRSFTDSGDDLLFINALLVPDKESASIQNNQLFRTSETVLTARVNSKNFQLPDSDIEQSLLNARLQIQEKNGFPEEINYIWDIIKSNKEVMISDYKQFFNKSLSNHYDNAAVIGSYDNIFIEDNVRIDPFVCLDVSGGPVIIKEGTTINSFSRIEGPCYIGKNCVILGAKIREGCAIGDNCRVGGEVEESIFHSFSNKYHDGFIGHSYIGEWVNLGAMTTNSDLKNNYSEIYAYLPDKRMRTGLMKLGSLIGDFVKTSIGTLITTGTSIGTGAMLIHEGSLCPSHIPSYAWYVYNEIKDLNVFGDFIETCKMQTSRRSVEFTEAHKDMLKHVFHLTAEARSKEALKWKKKIK